MAIYELEGVSPTLGKDTYIADSAQVMGDVVLGDGVSLWRSEERRVGKECA